MINASKKPQVSFLEESGAQDLNIHKPNPVASIQMYSRRIWANVEQEVLGNTGTTFRWRKDEYQCPPQAGGVHKKCIRSANQFVNIRILLAIILLGVYKVYKTKRNVFKKAGAQQKNQCPPQAGGVHKKCKPICEYLLCAPDSSGDDIIGAL